MWSDRWLFIRHVYLSRVWISDFRLIMSTSTDISQLSPNSGELYHDSTAKGIASLPQPSDGLILEIGPRMEGDLPLFSAIQTYPSCRFHQARRFPRPLHRSLWQSQRPHEVGEIVRGRMEFLLRLFT